MEHDRNQFIVNVFTNGAAPEEKRGDSQEHDMAYIESCREMFRLRQKLQHDISSETGRSQSGPLWAGYCALSLYR